MNIIERYLSAYVFHCLFPDMTSSQEHLDYIFQVLRESGSNPKNELLRNVLNYIRQSDPSDLETQAMVRNYILAMTEAIKPMPAPAFIGKYHQTDNVIQVVVLKEGQPVAFAGCLTEYRDKCWQELEETFPGIQMQES